MKAAILLFLLLGQQIPKNNPNGVWLAESGSKFNLRLNGNDLKVQIVEGSNPRFLKYELDLKGESDPSKVNSYAGKGYFTTKFPNGKECRFDTEWQIIVVSPERIMGVASSITPDPDTCAVKEKTEVQLDLKKN